ncbi:DNA primase [Gulosibacter molinativorax]|uniref:DNA primase n=1 Tax=Gulosibacter molinativorax TaxID=256821 RepID=A0ABT7C4T1_9MICO|nr:DNA primase [Gulosibacter molinativorax]MDJ1369807.1 DNA primase [Gulosibacter molinativorax]QUY61772.1 DNA primase [Gulosibacter molinativorax]
MARIRRSDIDEIRARTNIEDVVGEYVTLKSAGVGSKKGLCPFHDERTPSFHVRPQLGFYHCFGCGESGDVFSFLQKMDHVTFVEAVEKLAGKLGYQLTYEDGGEAPDHSKRVRLLAATGEAEQFFQGQLSTAEAQPARDFLGGRGFDPAAAARFGVGFAPQSWDALTKHLRGRGFSMQEMQDAGLVSTNERGSSYDRFRGRVIWPIRDTSGQTVGFGARKLLDEDKGPKYLNTPETEIYHKSRVLYGLDLAKKDIGRSHEVVVVEGYTDVMAAHLAGVTTAVATCGTAFGVDHIKVLRRIMDDESHRGRVIFNFDPDEAGRKAAMRAFAEENRFVAQTFVAVAPEGFDPCDLRLHRGDQAVRSMVENPQPMYEFVIREQLRKHNLRTAEGRVAALREAAPIIVGIRDRALRPEYERQLSGWLGMDLEQVRAAVASAERQQQRASDYPPDYSPEEMAAAGGYTVPAVRMQDLPNDPVTRLERDTLSAILQYPKMLSDAQLNNVLDAEFSNSTLSIVRDAIIATQADLGTPQWLPRVQEEVPSSFMPLVNDLSMAPLPAGNGPEQVAAYVRSMAAALVERDLLHRKAELLGELRRTDIEIDPLRHRELSEKLVDVERRKRDVRESLEQQV